MGSRKMRLGVAWCFGLVLVAAVCASGRAAITLENGRSNLDGSYSYDVQLDEAFNLNAFTVELILSATALNPSGDPLVPGTDFYLTGDIPFSNYVFGSTLTGKFKALANPAGDDAGLILSDYFNDPTTGVDGISVFLGTVTIHANSNVVATTLLEIEFEELLEAEEVVPEPASLAIWGLGTILGGVGFRRRWTKFGHQQVS